MRPHCGIPALVVHNRDDAVISYSDAEALATLWPELEVMRTQGLGHRDIPANGDFVQAVAVFIAG
jgi:hypothetical protein